MTLQELYEESKDRLHGESEPLGRACYGLMNHAFGSDAMTKMVGNYMIGGTVSSRIEDESVILIAEIRILPAKEQA